MSSEGGNNNNDGSKCQRDKRPPTEDQEAEEEQNETGDEITVNRVSSTQHGCRNNNKVITNTTKSNSNTMIIELPSFCTVSVPEFTPLGGSRPDAAVLACTAVWMEGEEEEEKKDAILPPDVLDTALAMLCAPP